MKKKYRLWFIKSRVGPEIPKTSLLKHGEHHVVRKTSLAHWRIRGHMEEN